MHPTLGTRGMCILALAILAGATLGALEQVQATEIIDQSQELANISYSQPFTGEEQTFRPTYDNITAISVWVFGAGTVTVQLFDASCGNLLGSGTTSSSGDGWVKVGLGAPIPVTPEVEYAFHVDGTMLSYAGGNPNPYPRGRFNFECAQYFAYDATFRTHSDDTLLPITPTPWSVVKGLYR